MGKKEPEPDFSKLRFVRIFTPVHIPKYLIEQLKNRDYEVDDWYKYMEIVCIQDTPNGPQLNPLTLLYVVVDEGNKVIGMLWCDVGVLSKTLVIQLFSIDNAYWHKGQAAMMVADKVKEIGKECKMKKVVWVTRGPKHSEYYGFKKSKESIMEYDLEEDPGYGKRSVQRQNRCPAGKSDGPDTVKIPATGDADSGATSHRGDEPDAPAL